MARIVLGITGSVAAYKGAGLARAFVRRGHEVRALLTTGGSRFVTPLQLQALTGHPVPSDQWHPTSPDAMDHIRLAQWGDALVVAPATADYLAKAACGLADDLLTTVTLAFTGDRVVVPAMNTRMLENAATQESLNVLTERGFHIVASQEGDLACGEQGAGKMAEPDAIADRVEALLAERLDFSGVRALVTAGPTAEAIDPVRIVTNRSSGRMGFALATALAERGARVALVAGPTPLQPPSDLAEVVRVQSSAEMEEAVTQKFEDCDLLVMAAAVSDWRPVEQLPQKIARDEGLQELRLEPTTDILASLAEHRGDRFVVGFALETEDPIGRGQAKLERKGLDAIAVNDPTEPGAGPDEETNHIWLIHRDGTTDELPLAPKDRIAHQMLDRIHSHLNNRRG